MSELQHDTFSYTTSENTFTYLACYMLSNVQCSQTQTKCIVHTCACSYILHLPILNILYLSTSFKILVKVLLHPPARPRKYVTAQLPYAVVTTCSTAHCNQALIILRESSELWDDNFSPYAKRGSLLAIWKLIQSGK